MLEKKQLDGIIFDIDGTIWDVRQVIADSWAEALKQCGMPAPFDAERLGRLFGKPMDEIFHTLYPDVSEEKMEQVIPVLYEYEHRALAEQKPAPYPGVAQVMEQLAEHYPLYIVTNGQKGYVEAMLGATGLTPYVKGWLCFGDTQAPKEVTIRRLMAQYGLEHVVYVGDTQGDADSCQAAGVPFIYAAYGLGQVAQPIYTIRDIRELPDVLLRMEQGTAACL